MPIDPKISDGPIPGENFTSDTRNYPWHRPPELTDLDEAIEASIKQLTKKEQAYALLTMLQAGVTCVQATDMFVTSGIGQGKWTPDFALLLAGPVSHMIKLMAEGYGIKYEMGLEDEPPSTIQFLKAAAKLDPDKVVTVADKIKDQSEFFKAQASEQGTSFASMEDRRSPIPPKATGLMGMPSPTSPEPTPDEGSMEPPQTEDNY